MFNMYTFRIILTLLLSLFPLVLSQNFVTSDLNSNTSFTKRNLKLHKTTI